MINTILALIVGNENYPYGINLFGFEIRFYALCILVGATVAYFLSCKAYKKKGYDPEVLTNIFPFVLLIGIFGARVWYVIADEVIPSGNLGYLFSLHLFNFTNGGLAIQGGVLLAVLSAVLIAKIKYYKTVSVSVAFDSVLPTILLAQAFGRWGNFFNHEVYGKCVNAASLSFIPSFILKNIGGTCNPGQVAVPLFLVESFINVAGFLLLYYLVKKLVFNKSWYRDGSLGFCYFIFYGLVRLILEPLRNQQFIMGDYVSVYMSLVYIIIGLVGIFLCEFYVIIKPKVKILVWDLDGTILDNATTIKLGIKHIYEKYAPNYKVTEEVLESYLGPSLKESFKRHFPGLPYQDLIKEYRRFQAEENPIPIVLHKGVKEGLELAKQKGIINVILTTKEVKVAEANLKRLGIAEYISEVYGFERVKRMKPSAEGLIKIMKKYKVLPFNLIMIGDNLVDINCAKAVFARSGGVAYSHAIKKLLDRHCDYKVDNIKDFVEKL